MPKSKNRWLVGLSIVAGVVIVLLIAAFFAFRPTTVPDLRTKTVSEAHALVQAAGLELGTPSEVATGAVGEGRIVEQRPAALTRAPSRSSVDVTVAVAPVPADVPDVAGRDSAEAVRVLTSALYIPVVVDIFDQGASGTVLDQAPAAGTSWMTGRPVAIGVAVGPDDGTGVTVPDLRGDSLEEALAKLQKVGLNGNGFVTQINSPESNVVVDQLPNGGLVVRPGTTVLLLFEAP